MIEKELLKIIKGMKGRLLGIGMDSERLKEGILKNSQIVSCTLLELNQKKTGKVFLKEKTEKLEKISIKKIQKHFKKKQIEYMICNIEDIKGFLKTFLRDSIDITNQKIYFYGRMDTEEIIRRYKRYGVSIEEKKYQDGSLLIVDVFDITTHFWRNKGYYFLDSFSDLRNWIADILMN